MFIVHACTVIKVHTCTMIRVHGCTMFIVHASTMIIIHSCTASIVHACTMVIVHGSCPTRLMVGEIESARLGVKSPGKPRGWGSLGPPTNLT